MIKYKALILSDIHCPFEDRKLFQEILEFARDISPSAIFLLGDFTDFYSISRFDKSRDRAEDLQFEIDQLEILFKALRLSAPDSPIFAICGNHEARLQKFLNRPNTKCLSGLKSLQIESLLNLDKYNIHWVDYAFKLTPNLLLKHGDRLGMHPAKAELKAEHTNGISGHSHRTDTFRQTGFDKTIQWWSLGHLACKKQLDKHYSQAYRWDQSFALVQYEGSKFDVEIIACDKGKFFCKYNQKHYGAKK